MLKSSNKPWSDDENLVVFNLYWKLPFGKFHQRNPDVCRLADLLDRTPSSIAMRLSNFASLDPSLAERGIQGLKSVSGSVKAIWTEFQSDPEGLAFKSEVALASRLGIPVEQVADVNIEDAPVDGKVREAIVRVRVNQSLFRKRVLSAYEYRCCITGISLPELLLASHIVPWSRDVSNRLNPRNGLCLNPLHDRAFDSGLIWIDDSLVVHSSQRLKAKNCVDSEFGDWLRAHEGRALSLPHRFRPDSALLAWHRENVAGV